MTGDNPLSGMRIPSLDELIDEAMADFGQDVTLNLADPKDRVRLRRAIAWALDRIIRWDLSRPLAEASERAIRHVLRTMIDPDHARKRTQARAESAKRSLERRRAEQTRRAAEAEERRQQQKGLVQ